jgi:serine/threonine-protein kinase
MEETDPLIGQTLGNYHVHHLLGAGAMGQVFLGVHPQIDRQVAIKVLNRNLSARPDMSERFLSEARAVNHINHPNIVQVFDFGTLPDGRLYLIMELLSGENVGSYLDRKKTLSIEETLGLVRQIASGLDAAHETGIVHRDLKPDNVYIIHSKFGQAVKLLDFGIAKLLEPELRGGGRTATGIIMGTPAYMSPEQAMGQTDEIRPSSDIYSLGVMVYQMLSGRLPFEADYVPQILVKHVSEPPTPISRYIPEFPPPIWQVLEKAMAKESHRRPPTAGDFYQEFATAAAAVAPSRARTPYAMSMIPPPDLRSIGVDTTSEAGRKLDPAAGVVRPKKRLLVLGTVVALLVLGGLFLPAGRCSFEAGEKKALTAQGPWDAAAWLSGRPAIGSDPADSPRGADVPAAPVVGAADPDQRPILFKFVITTATAGIPVQVQVNAEKPFTVNTPFTYYAPKNAIVIVSSQHPSYREATQSFSAVQDMEVELAPTPGRPSQPSKPPSPAGPAGKAPGKDLQLDVPEPQINAPYIPPPLEDVQTQEPVKKGRPRVMRVEEDQQTRTRD